MDKFLFVIGDPILHTKSPGLHNACLRHFGKTDLYLPLRIHPSSLKNFARFARNSGNVLGFNVTLPHKETILKHLDWVEKKAKIIGAVNCVRVKGGKLLGFNTDAEAFCESVVSGTSFQFKGKRVLLFGAGGGSRALIYQLCKNKISELVICNRTRKKGLFLKKHFSKIFPKIKMRVVPFQKTLDEIGKFDLVVNSTSLTENFDLKKFPLSVENCLKSTVFVDVNYGPGRLVLKTWLNNVSKTNVVLKKAIVLNGQDMLIRQAAKSFNLWYGCKYSECVRIMGKSMKHQRHSANG